MKGACSRRTCYCRRAHSTCSSRSQRYVFLFSRLDWSGTKVEDAPSGTGFNADEGASLLMTFGGLQAESVAQGEVHRAIAKELETLVVDPFEDWARGHKVQ